PSSGRPGASSRALAHISQMAIAPGLRCGPMIATPCANATGPDLPSLRRALLIEAHEIYAPVSEEHRTEIPPLRPPRSLAAAFCDRLRRRVPIGLTRDAPEPARSRADQASRRQESQRRLLEWWAQQRNDYARSTLFASGVNADIGSKRAQERGIRLLKENLTLVQRRQYEKYGYFDFTGGISGKRYRFRHGPPL